ncbi:MAG TPA: type VII secretion protein EccB [Pseudonocardiaceae bacterium]|nr:type VII secretion protein EccB [Pseudonocardiaceae bacterium]
MWTQRDQIQAYQFLRRRLVSALVTGDANHPTSPSRRLVLGTILGIAAAVLTAAVFGVIGLLNPSGSNDWQQGGQVIVERETGARYALGAGGQLVPVLNYASARLYVGGNGDQTVTVSASTLRGAPRGQMVGIPGAPDSLPATDSLSDNTFTSCTRTPGDRPASSPPVATVILGPTTPGGRALPGNQALLVVAPSGDDFLITAGHRFRLAGQAPAAALGYEGVPTFRVAENWLDTVPVGRDLGLVAVPGAGAPGPSVGGRSTLVGQILTDGSYYLVQRDGLAPVSQTEALLVLGDSANSAAYPDGRQAALPLPVAALDTAPRSPSAEDTAGYPRAVPKLAPADQSTVLCSVGNGDGDARIMTSAGVPLPAGGRSISVDQRTDDRVADEVFVPPGTGALLRQQVGGGQPGPEYLVTDTGMKYPVPTAADVTALGYGNVPATPVAGTVLDLLPQGPSLDIAAARQLAPGGDVPGGGAR